MNQPSDANKPPAGADESWAPIHVLHVADADAFARFGPMFRQLGLALSHEGVAGSLLTDDGPGADDLDGTPVEDYWYPALDGWRSWRLESYLNTSLHRPPDVVHLWGLPAVRLFSRWTAARRIPLILHVTRLDQVQYLRRRGLRAHEYLLAACRGLADSLADLQAVPVVAPALLAPREVRPHASDEPHTLGIVYAGRIEADTGLDVLVDATRLLRQREVDVQVGLIGNGSAADDVWHRAVRSKVADCISLTDGPRIWERVIPGADICVVPACQMRVGLAPLLAMAHERVVIASDDQLAEWFNPDQTTLAFAAGDPGALVTQVMRVVERHPAALAIPRAAHEYVREHHAISRMATSLLKEYREQHARMLS